MICWKWATDIDFAGVRREAGFPRSFGTANLLDVRRLVHAMSGGNLRCSPAVREIGQGSPPKLAISVLAEWNFKFEILLAPALPTDYI